ncbi:immunoglobulin superfamily member 11 isoform X1 [Gadus morhua]|uniref:immunoglobulin superfamily member 11 isoform X1 n=1 Tax=Gadus morhua TaxID=8049 RepID=UPI0011B7ACDE|nr:immunoglobulin superfamily member 11 isoform X1 [Gadus morhua]
MLKFHNSDLWIAWIVIFCMEGSRFDLNTAKVCVRALDVTVSQSSIQVARGQAAVLPCSFTTSAALNNLNIIWMVIPLSNANQPEQRKQVIIYQGGQVFSLANHLNGRVGFVATMPSTSASIFINNTQLTDTGTYQCLVNNLPDRGGRNIGVIGLTVLVPPSVPTCRVQGSLDVGSDVLLLCSSEEGTPTPSYSWEKLDALPRLPHTAMQDQMQGTVTLRNISSSTSGLYQCSSSNAVGKSTCLLNLQVVSPQPQSVGLIAGTIATGVLALIICSLLVVVSLFYWKNKNKYDEEEIPNEIREDDLPPKRSSSGKAFHADASSSENDTLTSTNTYNSRYWHNPKPNYDTNSYTRYNGDTRHTFSTAATHGTHPQHVHGQHPGHAHPHGHGHAHGQGHGHGHGHGHGPAPQPPPPPPASLAAGAVSAPGSAPLPRHAPPQLQGTTATLTSSLANGGSHTLPPPKTLVVTTNSAPSPAVKTRSNGAAGHKGAPASARGQHTHSYAVSQATLERMGAVPVMVPAQSRAGSLV